MAFSSRVHVGYYVAGDGSRLINVTQSNQYVNNVAFTSLWGTPEIVEGVDNNAAPWFNPAVANSIITLLEPTFSAQAGGSVQRYRVQSDNDPVDQTNAYFQNIGFTTPRSNAEADAFVYGSGSSTTGTYFNYYVNSGSAAVGELGGAINYYTWNPSYHQDVARTEGIQGVRVRTRTGFDLNDSTNTGTNPGGNRFVIDNGTAANIADGMIAYSVVNQSSTSTVTVPSGWLILDLNGDYYRNTTNAAQTVTSTFTAFTTGNGWAPDEGIDRTGDDLDRINEYLTDANGLIVADANTRYSSNGAAFNTGWIDWLQMGARDVDSATAGGNSTGSGFGGVEVPNNHIITPIQFIGKGAYNQYSTSYEARSYSHDVDVIDEQNGVVGTGTGQQVADTLIPIQDAPVVGANLSTSRIKPANTNADNSPNFDSFTADSTVSLNDIGNALRAGWASYNVNANQGTVLQTGNFNETTYPTRIHIRTAAETGGNTWQDPKWGVKVASAGSGGQIRIAVLGNGIAGKDDDLYETLPGARTYNFAGLPLSNVVLGAQERLARIGNIHNVELSSGLDGTGPSGSNDFYDIQFETDSNTITGLTTLTPGSARIASQAVINLPTVVGDSASDVTLTRGRIIQSYAGGSGNTIGVEGIRDNSSWVNFSTSTDVTSTVLPNVTINGGTHGFTIGGLNTSTAVWEFLNMEANAMNMTLPAGTPTPLVRINTDNQAGNLANYNEVKRWLDAEVARDSTISYSNVRLDETAPTTGYWLVAPPLAPAEPRTFTVAPPIANLTNSVLQNVIAAGGSFVYETGGTVTSHHISSATTLADVTITTDNESDDDYNIWYKPLSYVDGNDSIIYDYNHTTWNPTTDASGSVGIFQPDPNGAVTGTATFDSTTSGVITFGTPVRTGTALSVTLTSASDDSGAVQSLGWAIANSSQYMEYVAANVYTNASTRPLQFDKSGTGATTTFATNITLRSTTGQRFLNGASGFVTQQAGTAPNTFPEVRGSATNVIFGSDAQISALAGGDAITELGNELKANQGKLSTDVRLASQLRPASGTIPNTAD